MKKVFSLTVIAALLSLPVTAQTPTPQSVLYHNATLLNPATEQQLADGWLLVEDGRIVRIGQQQGTAVLPAASKTVDLQDHYVMPGLIDVHLHLTAGPMRVEMQDGKPVITLKGHSELTRYMPLVRWPPA